MVEKVKIAKAVERELDREEQAAIHKLAEEDLQTVTTAGDGKNILIMVGVIVGIFVLTLGSFKVYNQFTGAGVIVVDDLHQKNLDGDLDADEGYLYNGYSIVKADGLWWTEIDAGSRVIKIPLHFGPKEVEEIHVSGKLSSQFDKGNIVYIAIDPEVNYNKYYTLALMEMNNNILQGINRNIEAACTKENAACDNRTIINCDATDGKPVIELAVSESSEIEFSGSCIKISGDNEALVKAVDRMLYTWYGIMN
ncbi:MAG: hypothetical protein AABW53_02730 [Nanoarchaeota archaeon]